MKTIILHQSPDIDALTGAYVYVKLLQLQPDQYQIKILPEKGDVYIDCRPEKENGPVEVYDHHQPNSPYQSATEAVYENLLNQNLDIALNKPFVKALKKIVECVNKLDNAKYPEAEFRAGLIDTILAGVKLKSEDVIKKAFELWDYVMESLILYEASKIVPHEVHYVHNFKIITYELSPEHKANPSPYFFSEEGASFCIFKQGNNIGISRNANIDSISLTGLQEYIDEEGWYFHPSGFIAAHGTYKYPAQKPSKYSVYDLLEMLRKLILKNQLILI